MQFCNEGGREYTQNYYFVTDHVAAAAAAAYKASTTSKTEHHISTEEDLTRRLGLDTRPTSTWRGGSSADSATWHLRTAMSCCCGQLQTGLQLLLIKAAVADWRAAANKSVVVAHHSPLLVVVHPFVSPSPTWQRERLRAPSTTSAKSSGRSCRPT